MKQHNEYRTVNETNLVLIKVPPVNRLNYIPPHIFQCGDQDIPMDEHYKFCIHLDHKSIHGKKIVVNQKFFGIDSRDAGKLIVAKVTIEEKLVKDNRTFTQILVERVSHKAKARRKMNITQHAYQGIPIHNTNYFIEFCKLQNN